MQLKRLSWFLRPKVVADIKVKTKTNRACSSSGPPSQTPAVLYGGAVVIGPTER